jgi:hypothetical protein
MEIDALTCVDHHGHCSFSTTQCCHCIDKRTVLTIYLDSYGLIQPEKYGVGMPKDLYYCASCKSSDTPTIGVFTKVLRDALPNPSDFFRLKKIDDDIEKVKAKHTEVNASRRRISERLVTQQKREIDDLMMKRDSVLSDISLRGSMKQTNSYI